MRSGGSATRVCRTRTGTVSTCSPPCRSADEPAHAHTGQGANIAGQVSLVGIADLRRGGCQWHSGSGEVQSAVHPHDPVELLGTVTETDQAAAVQLTLRETEAKRRRGHWFAA